mmetsp:Transcript_58245/g.134485  ORF Transcript_58245/g.134485 Transcript_58245/m.134485 type:complete len:212 (+) Transcript_58245:1263-1898(+)
MALRGRMSTSLSNSSSESSNLSLSCRMTVLVRRMLAISMNANPDCWVSQLSASLSEDSSFLVARAKVCTRSNTGQATKTPAKQATSNTIGTPPTVRPPSSAGVGVTGAVAGQDTSTSSTRGGRPTGPSSRSGSGPSTTTRRATCTSVTSLGNGQVTSPRAVCSGGTATTTAVVSTHSILKLVPFPTSGAHNAALELALPVACPKVTARPSQ